MVGLIVVEAHIPLAVRTHVATRVVGASVEGLLLLGGVVPGVVGLFLTVPGEELHHGVVAEIAALQQVGVELGAGAVEVALRTDVRQPSLHAPVSTQQSRTEAQRLLVGVVGTAAEVKAHIGCCPDVLRLHIDRCTERSSTIGRRTDTALNLHRLHTAGEVAHIHPEELRALSVVHRHTIGSDVDARGVCAAHAQGGVADAIACIAGHRDGGGQRQQVGDVLAVVDGLQRLPVHVSEGHRRVLPGSC